MLFSGRRGCIDQEDDALFLPLPCGVTLHAALQNKAPVPRVTNSTVMKLHESDNRGGGGGGGGDYR